MAVYDDRMQLSRYRELYPLKDDCTVQLVRDDRTGELFVKKTLDICRRDVCESLVAQPVPGMPRIYSVTLVGEQTVLIEEYINGRTLQDIIDENGELRKEQALPIFRRIAETVQRLHNRNPEIIHRDIKPDNIIICADGSAFLTDVDAAKPFEPGLPRDTVLFGTAGYAAPEQYGFGGSGVYTDIYALGVLLNVMVTGRQPRETCADGLIGRVVGKATQMEPSQRYKSVGEMLADIFGKEAVNHERGWLRFMPPGMRSGDLLTSVLSAIGYILLIYLSATLDFASGSKTVNIINRIGFFISVMFAILFYGDYLEIRTRSLLRKIKNPVLRIVLSVIIGMILFCIPAFICTFFD